jgi:hypothetical protein
VGLRKAGLAAGLHARQANVMPDKHMKEISRLDAYVLARSIAKRIVSGELSEYEGGMTIWKEVIDKMGPGCPDDLWPFKANASAIEDIKWNVEQGGNGNERLIRQCEQEIFEAARKLANQLWREGWE